MYEPVKDYLEKTAYDVYPEVSVRGDRADIIARSGPAICVVEMKTNLSMDLLDQAIRWVPYAHYIYIAIPRTNRRRRRRIPDIVNKVLRQHKIGILEVDVVYNEVHNSLPARFNRPGVRLDWDKVLTPLHKEWDIAGGSPGGGYLTDYKITILGVKSYLRREKTWVTMKDILNHCETHYASPKNSLAKALKDWENDWCESKLSNGRLFFRYKEGK